MASPYQYPHFMYQTPYLHPYYQQQVVTPFIPQVTLPPSPNAGSGSRQVRFADEDGYPPTRPRPPSWYAGMPGTAPAPNPAPFPSPPFVYTPLPPVMPLAGPPPAFAHQRRRSDVGVSGVHPGWVSVPTWMVYPQYQQSSPPSQFHPLLNGENSQPLLFLDFSIHAFNPVRATKPGNTTGSTLTLDELAQQATHPGVTRMTITIEGLPQWPVILEPSERITSGGYLTVPAVSSTHQPITVGDILVAAHRMLQTQITHRDWVRLSENEAIAVARAYTKRCRTFPTAEQFEASQGVRKVDYLQDRCVLKGLIRSRGEDNFEYVKLLVGRK